MGEIWKELSAISRELSAELRMETRPAPGSGRVRPHSEIRAFRSAMSFVHSVLVFYFPETCNLKPEPASSYIHHQHRYFQLMPYSVNGLSVYKIL